jgi:hypothetical protein
MWDDYAVTFWQLKGWELIARVLLQD